MTVTGTCLSFLTIKPLRQMTLGKIPITSGKFPMKENNLFLLLFATEHKFPYSFVYGIIDLLKDD
jgi:hypothetical protein